MIVQCWLFDCRVEAYRNNNNFVIDVPHEDAIAPDFEIRLDTLFKDINSTAVLPPTTHSHVPLFRSSEYNNFMNSKYGFNVLCIRGK